MINIYFIYIYIYFVRGRSYRILKDERLLFSRLTRVRVECGLHGEIRYDILWLLGVRVRNIISADVVCGSWLEECRGFCSSVELYRWSRYIEVEITRFPKLKIILSFVSTT